MTKSNSYILYQADPTIIVWLNMSKLPISMAYTSKKKKRIFKFFLRNYISQNEKRYIHNIFTIFLQKVIGGKMLLVLFWTHNWNYFLSTNNNQ